MVKIDNKTEIQKNSFNTFKETQFASFEFVQFFFQFITVFDNGLTIRHEAALITA
jgi:hypothetical protein